MPLKKLILTIYGLFKNSVLEKISESIIIRGLS